MNSYRYVIAEDEPALAVELATLLQQTWPTATCVGTAGNGNDARSLIQSLEPDVLFLDVRMPGCDGLELASELVRKPAAPLIVFVTAFDEYALDAFGTEALDYLLKPVEPERLSRCIERLCQRLGRERRQETQNFEHYLKQALESARTQRPPLRYIRAGTEHSIKLIPIDEVLYFEAQDKYVAVRTADTEALIRTSLRQLVDSLDPDVFWQVHRRVIVNAKAIASTDRDPLGRIRLSLRDCATKLSVSRSYAHHFRPM